MHYELLWKMDRVDIDSLIMFYDLNFMNQYSSTYSQFYITPSEINTHHTSSTNLKPLPLTLNKVAPHHQDR